MLICRLFLYFYFPKSLFLFIFNIYVRHIFYVFPNYFLSSKINFHFQSHYFIKLNKPIKVYICLITEDEYYNITYNKLFLDKNNHNHSNLKLVGIYLFYFLFFMLYFYSIIHTQQYIFIMQFNLSFIALCILKT